MSVETLTFNNLAREIHATAKAHGWWPIDTLTNVGMALCLVHSEVSEALEHYRNGHSMFQVWTDDNGKPDGIPVELADVIIRVLDICAAYGIDIDQAVRLKMAYNDTRPMRHGGKLV